MNTIRKIDSTIEPSGSLLKLLLVDCLLDENHDELVNKLKSLESSIVETCSGIDNLVTKVTTLQPDVLVLSVQSLQEKALIELTQLHEECPLPVIVIAKEYAPKLVETVIPAGISSYLIDEVSAERLMVILELSVARFKQEQHLICELKETKERLSERKLIERAKGIIMQQKNLSEEQAYSQMRKSAMNQGQSMASLSKHVISVFEMLE